MMCIKERNTSDTTCKKLLRVIYTLEKNNIDFDPSLLK